MKSKSKVAQSILHPSQFIFSTSFELTKHKKTPSHYQITKIANLAEIKIKITPFVSSFKTNKR